MTPIVKSILRLNSLLLLLLLYAMSSNAQVANVKLEQELLNLEKALNMGVRTHDTTALKGIIGSEYQLTGPKFSQPVHRKQWLENCFLWSFDSATITNISLSSWEEVAVFRSLQYFHNLVVGSNKPTAKSPGVWVTDLWVKREEKWQLITRLSERMPAK